MKYRVEHWRDSTYQILHIVEHETSDPIMIPVVFQGSLADCEAWIRLKQSEDIDF